MGDYEELIAYYVGPNYKKPLNTALNLRPRVRPNEQLPTRPHTEAGIARARQRMFSQGRRGNTSSKSGSRGAPNVPRQLVWVRPESYFQILSPEVSPAEELLGLVLLRTVIIKNGRPPGISMTRVDDRREQLRKFLGSLPNPTDLAKLALRLNAMDKEAHVRGDVGKEWEDYIMRWDDVCKNDNFGEADRQDIGIFVENHLGALLVKNEENLSQSQTVPAMQLLINLSYYLWQAEERFKVHIGVEMMNKKFTPFSAEIQIRKDVYANAQINHKISWPNYRAMFYRHVRVRLGKRRMINEPDFLGSDRADHEYQRKCHRMILSYRMVTEISTLSELYRDGDVEEVADETKKGGAATPYVVFREGLRMANIEVLHSVCYELRLELDRLAVISGIEDQNERNKYFKDSIMEYFKAYDPESTEEMRNDYFARIKLWSIGLYCETEPSESDKSAPATSADPESRGRQ